MDVIAAQNYVYLDGAYIEEQHLINMAKQAGSITIAEHYLCNLLHHALIHGKTYLAQAVDDIRRTYKLSPYPIAVNSPNTPNNMSCFSRPESELNAKARELYKTFDEEKKDIVMKRSLVQLTLKDKSLFKSKTCWIGIFLVVRDRLCKISQKEFTTFAERCAPSDWNDALLIGENTLSNLGRKLGYEKDEAYYDMRNNPFNDLCKTFWMILRNEILTAE